ncbi:hypothetical protein JHD50_07135 [Sulfurimonas sp. MAG313]|nr:CsgG/HfaB family protein [Sulfurimonas sp. MAG313]MDF1881080.1 hypothetical protein [Sulfurimonas sp. MAG313]
MKISNCVLLGLIILMSGCAQKVRIKALNPAEVGAMASKKKVAITSFKNDHVGLSAKIETQIAKYQLDKKRYFTVLSRKDLAKVMAEQKLQSSELMDETTATKIGKLVGAQALVNGEVTSSGDEGSYEEAREKCLSYYKDGSGCARYKHYKVTCRTTEASVSGSINIVNMEDGSLVYADTISKNYNGDSCKDGVTNLGLLSIRTGDKKILSKGQALQMLSNKIANEFVYKLTPHYFYFNVTILDEVEYEINESTNKSFTNALALIKAGRMDKAEKILTKVNDGLNGKSYVVAYDLGVIKEARAQFDSAKKFYAMADELTEAPIAEINSAVLRIDRLIAKRDQAKAQINR